MGFLDAIGLGFGSSGKRRPDRVSNKNKNRTGGQSSGGVGKNAAHLSPAKKAAGKKKVTHTIKAKGQRGFQGGRK
jgi:hypothetical protein